MVIDDGFVLIQIRGTSAHRHNAWHHFAVFVADNGCHLDVLLAASLSPSEFARDECQIEVISNVSWHNHFGKAHFTSDRHVALHHVRQIVLGLKQRAHKTMEFKETSPLVGRENANDGFKYN